MDLLCPQHQFHNFYVGVLINVFDKWYSIIFSLATLYLCGFFFMHLIKALNYDFLKFMHILNSLKYIK